MRHILLLAVLFFVPFAASARVGVVQTKNGKVLRGQIRFSSSGVTIINASDQTSLTIALTNLSDVFFDPQFESPADGLLFRPQDKVQPAWQAEDIGSVSGAGSLELVSGLFRVRSVGTNIAGRTDSFHFVYRPCTGNCEIVARVVNLPPRTVSRAGIMIRETLSADSVNVFVGLTARTGGVLQHRDDPAGETEANPYPEMFVPYWLRLKRTGNDFTTSASRNGTHWTKCQTVSFPMSPNAHIGLAATAGEEQISGIATLDNVRQDVFVPQTSFIPQIHLQSGSVIAGPILSGDQNSFTVQSFPFTVPASAVSHVLFRWLPFRYTTQLGSGTHGLLLNSGEFVEAELSRLENRSVTVSSVLFGAKSFDIDSDVMALVLRRPFDIVTPYTVVTVDGTTLRAKKLELGDYELILSEGSLGARTLGMPEILWLRCAP